MVDISKHIAYWKKGALEDLQVSKELVERGRVRHGLFFAHLSLEKLLKALVCKKTGDLAPRIHNLLRLAELAGLEPTPDKVDALAEMNAFQVEGRYPESLTPPPTPDEATKYLVGSEEIFQWLMRQL